MNRVIFLTMVAAVLLTMTLPAEAGTRGECVTAVVESPFRLPDGLLYPAGTLTLCDYGAFSPVDTLHRILVGGASVGLFRSRRGSAEDGSLVSPEVLFNRDAEGNLELLGYATPSSGRVTAYRMKPHLDVLQTAAREWEGGSGAPLAAIVANARAGR